jgi:hypothetical protein
MVVGQDVFRRNSKGIHKIFDQTCACFKLGLRKVILPMETYGRHVFIKSLHRGGDFGEGSSQFQGSILPDKKVVPHVLPSPFQVPPPNGVDIVVERVLRIRAMKSDDFDSSHEFSS